ncbi:MAG: methyltransferase domain-containing protein [Candidatus Saccharimonadales bacterium]
MYIAILGRQPAIGMAELECVFGDVRWFSDQSAVISSATPVNIERLGGTLKVGRVVAELPRADWRQASMKLVRAYANAWADRDGKVTVGISAYGFDVRASDIQKTGIILKRKLKDSGVSMRLIPNAEPVLNTATSHHNKLGLSDNKIELLVVRARNGKVMIAESVGAQNITALARRDQERPKRDAFVGMLPPKLAQIMTNLATASVVSSPGMTPTLLDPFCGTGVLLQEALLLGYNVVGTDLSDKMVDYSRINLDWIKTISHVDSSFTVTQGDAMSTTWPAPIDVVACETYLGQPFSAPPSPSKLAEVRGNCNHIVSTFLTNIGHQLTAGTPLCVAVPAWRATDGSFTHLPLVANPTQLGYDQVQLKNVRSSELLYYREDQVVARELLLLTKK